MKDFLSREAIANLITTTQNATYSDVVEVAEDGGERLREEIDPLVARSIEEMEFLNGRVVAVKLAGKPRHNLANRASKNSSGKK